MSFSDLLFLLKLLNSSLEVIAFLCLFIDFVIEFKSLFPEDDHLLLQVLDSIVRGEHTFLFLRLMLDFCQLFFDFCNMITICEKKLGLVFLDDMLNFIIHVVDGPVEILVGLHNRLAAVISYEGTLIHLHSNNFIDL